ncbi:MAG: hypothetical protein ACOCRK_03165 [bacterium]
MKDYTITELIENVIDSMTKRHDIEDSEFELMSTNGLLLDGLVEIAENSLYKLNSAKRERFFVTAEQEDSLLKHGRRFEINPDRAIPAKMDVMLITRLEDVIDNAELDDNNIYRYIIYKDSEITIGDHYFNLDYNIQISIFDLNSTWGVSSAYMIDDTNDFSDLINPNIKTIRFKQNGQNYIGMIITINQFKRVSEEYTYVSNVDNRTFKVAYDDQLLDFNVYYQENEYSEKEKIEKTMFIGDRGEVQRNIFFRYLDNNEFLVMNKYELGHFFPERGSIFTIEKFITRGSEGNFTFEGGDTKLINNSDDNLVINVHVLSSAINGNDKLDTDGIRRVLVDKNITRGSLISTNDIARTLSNYDDRYKIIKFRDDVAYRIYNIFGVMSDDEDNILPTNTLDVDVDLSNFIEEDGEYMLPEKHIISASEFKGVLDDIEDERHKYIYPFNLTYDMSDNFITVFRKYIDKSFRVNYDFINSLIPVTYMVNNVYFNKKLDKDYKISFELRTNTAEPVDFLHDEKTSDTQVFTPSELDTPYNINRVIIDDDNASLNVGEINEDYIIDYDNNTIIFPSDTSLTIDGTESYTLTYNHEMVIEDKEYIKCMMLIKNDGILKGYLEMEMIDYIEDGDYYIYEKILNFNSILRANGTANIEMKDITTHETIEQDIDITNCDFEIYILSKDNIVDMSDPSITLNDYSVSNIFSFNAPIYEDITYLNYIQIINNTLSELTLRFMPLIGYDYFIEFNEKANQIINRNVRNLETLFNLMKDDFEYTLLFVNTYGKSRFHKIGVDHLDLDRTDLNISFRIGIKNGMSLEKDSIRDFVCSYFENIDYLNNENFHVSRLLKELKINFSEIDFIEFLGINEYSYEHQLISSDSEDIKNDTVPEYLNIFRKIVNNELVPDIDIVYV